MTRFESYAPDRVRMSTTTIDAPERVRWFDWYPDETIREMPGERIVCRYLDSAGEPLTLSAEDVAQGLLRPLLRREYRQSRLLNRQP